MTTGPAPTLLGEIVTFDFVMTPVSCSVTGGRGLLAKSLPPPQPANTSAARTAKAGTLRMRRVCRMTLIPRSGIYPNQPQNRPQVRLSSRQTDSGTRILNSGSLEGSERQFDDLRRDPLAAHLDGVSG